MRFPWPRYAFACVFAFIVTPATAWAAGYIEVLKLESESNLTDGYDISAWDSPLLNDRGEILTRITAISNSNVQPQVRRSLLRSAGRSWVPVATEGQAAPNDAGMITWIPDPGDNGQIVSYQINNTGRVAFVAESGPSRINTTNAIYYGNEQALVQLAPRIDPVTSDLIMPLQGTRRYMHFPALALNDSGQVAFIGGSDPKSAPARHGIFLASQDSISAIALSGDPIGSTELVWTDFGAVTLNESGQVAFFGGYGPTFVSRAAVARGDAIELAEIAGLGRRNPENNGILQPATGFGFSRTPVVPMNDLGDVVFVARNYQPDGPSPTTMLMARGDRLLQIAEIGSRDSAAAFERLEHAPRINNARQVAIRADAWLGGEGDQAVEGIFRLDGESVETIALGGQSDPRGSGSLDALQAPNINSRGQIVFEGRVWREDDDRAEEAIFFYDDELGLQTVAQAGDELDGKVVENVRGAFEGYQANLFDSGFNHFGQVAFRFRTVDSESGVALWSPYPDGDYTADMAVNQADLDLVLLNWGRPFEELDGWQSNPPGAVVEQAELDKVLLNWGTRAPASGAAAVPEPAGLVLLLSCIATAGTIRFWLPQHRCTQAGRAEETPTRDPGRTVGTENRRA